MLANYQIKKLTESELVQVLVNDYCSQTGALVVHFGTLVKLVYEEDQQFAEKMIGYSYGMDEELRRGPVLIWSK